jgi:sensor histidine kinase regulating citrate/malate metabolism
MARNLPNDRIDLSMPGGSARVDNAISILLSKHQRAKIGEVHRQGPAIPPSLSRTIWRQMREHAASHEAMALLRVQAQSRSLGGAAVLAMGSNTVASPAPGETS